MFHQLRGLVSPCFTVFHQQRGNSFTFTYRDGVPMWSEVSVSVSKGRLTHCLATVFKIRRLTRGMRKDSKAMSEKMDVTNPSGITNYDVGKYADLPEWHALTVAVSNLANAVNRAGIISSQTDLAEAVENIVHGVPYGDCCQRCGDPAIYTPHAVVVRDYWVNGEYRCTRGHYWNCGYAVDAAWILG